jgi:hypothetical protein
MQWAACSPAAEAAATTARSLPSEAGLVRGARRCPLQAPPPQAVETAAGTARNPPARVGVHLRGRPHRSHGRGCRTRQEPHEGGALCCRSAAPGFSPRAAPPWNGGRATGTRHSPRPPALGLETRNCHTNQGPPSRAPHGRRSPILCWDPTTAAGAMHPVARLRDRGLGVRVRYPSSGTAYPSSTSPYSSKSCGGAGAGLPSTIDLSISAFATALPR